MIPGLSDDWALRHWDCLLAGFRVQGLGLIRLRVQGLGLVGHRVWLGIPCFAV